MIKIWANKLDVCIPECIRIESGMTLLDWFHSDGLPEDAGLMELTSLEITVWINNEQIVPGVWHKTVIDPTTVVDIYREPKGTDPFSITFALVFGAKAVLSALMPKIPSVNTQSQKQGKELDEASTKGNRIKINDVIPELAGFNVRYPDILGPQRRYFVGPREQWVEMLLCVGKGEYQIDPATVKVGLTPFLSLGADARFAIYGPGQDISNEPAHLMWYPAPEVSATSTGAAGLELTASTTLTTFATASTFNFNSKTVSIPSGAGSFPTDWTDGLVINIGDPYVYTVTDGSGTAGRDVISGGNVANLGFVAGDLIEIQGDNQGLYEVFSATSTQLQLNYSGGAAAVGLAVGSVTMAIGFRGLKYQIVSHTAQSLNVNRIKTNGSIDAGWPGWTSNTSNSGQVRLDSSNLEGGYRGPFPASADNEKVTAIEWEMFFPSGLVGLGAKGEYFTIEANHQFEYRDADIGGAWTVGQYKASGNDLDAKGFTFRTNLPYPMRPECRAKKLVIPQGGLRPDEVHDTTMWYGLKGLTQSSKTSFEDCTVIAVYIRGGDRIASQTESLVNLEATRILPVLNGLGQWGPKAPTRKISSWLGHIARSVGYSDSDINMQQLQQLENIWSARGDTYDRLVTTMSTVKDNMIECLAAGFSELTIEKGKITPVRDQPRGENFKSMYNPQIMREPLSKDFVAPLPDDFDGVDVEYLDELTRSNLTVRCRLPGDLGKKVYKLKVEGVTNRDKAYQIGMRERSRQVYQHTEYSFSTEYDALNSAYGDYVALGDNITGYGKSAKLISFTPVGDVYLLVSSESFDWNSPGEHMVAIRRLDGSVSGPYKANRLTDDRLTINKEQFDSDPTNFYPDFDLPADPPFLQFGPEDSWCYPAIITEVNPNGTKYCSVKAVNYDERIYLYDDAKADN